MKRPFGLATAALAAVLTTAPGAWAQGLRGTAQAISDDVWTAMAGVSWHANLPCPKREALRYLIVPYVGFDGITHLGRMIVAAKVAEDVLDIFAEIYAAGFRIERMELVSAHGGDDDRSMAANNTSAFNCRKTTSGRSLSEHSFGTAIDINPVQNPFVTSRTTLPPAGSDYDAPDERSGWRRGVITEDGPVVAAFARRGWGWGGLWNSLKDYQHFSLSGR